MELFSAHASRPWWSFLCVEAGLGVALLPMLAGLGGAVFAYARRPWWSLLIMLAGLGGAVLLMLAGLGGAVFCSC